MNAEPVSLHPNSPPPERLQAAAKRRGYAMYLAMPCLLLAGVGIGIIAFSGFGENPWRMMPAGVLGIALVAFCPLMMGAMVLWMWARGHKREG